MLSTSGKEIFSGEKRHVQRSFVFSYEANFLFHDEEESELEYVCDCCDPKRKKTKKVSSEECSEEEEDELSEEEADEDSNDVEESNDSEDSRGLTSREESPAPSATQPAKSTKPLPPGWFGKGRSKRRRK